MPEGMDTASWQSLMDTVVEQALLAGAEVDNYTPGNALAPGSGTEGDDPLGLHYADLGHLAFVLNEAVDAAVTRGADRDQLIAEVARNSGEGVTPADCEKVLSGDTLCPPQGVLAAFSQQTAISLEIIIDAARRGGCQGYGPAAYAPGF
jgi:hypothetical protein